MFSTPSTPDSGHRSSHAAVQRQATVDALLAAGPEAPTLCEGWTARDLAAHLVIRERRPDASAGIVLPPLRGWGDRVRLGYAERDFAELVDLIRTGPPRFTLFAIPRAEDTLNLAEFFVHCEDVRRAAADWQPRPLTAELGDALWRLLTSHGQRFFRRSPVGVVLATPDGRRHAVKTGENPVQITGEPGELLLCAFGRTSHATVSVEGPDDAVAAFSAVQRTV